MKKIVIGFVIWLMRFVNLLFKPLKLKRKVVIISRQSDKPSLDINMIMEALEAQGINTVILCRTLKKTPAGALSFCFMTIRQIYHIATSKVVLLDGYCIPASVLPKKKGQSVIQMWHALGAVKKFGWQSVDNPDGHSAEVARIMHMHENYDYILAPCKETGKHFAEAFRTQEEKVVYIGLPRIDFIRTPDEEKKRQIEKMYPEVAGKTNVLYVPTFRKDAVLEVERLVDGFDFRKMNLIIKKHFLDKGDYSWTEEKGAIVDNRFSSLEWLKICQKVVTDYSAISFEAASIDRELYIFQPDVDNYLTNNGLNIDMTRESLAPYVCKTEEELFRCLDKDYDKNAVMAFKNKFLAINLNHCTQDLCDFVISQL